MTARSHHRGHPVHYDGVRWVYTDTGEPSDIVRPCVRCGELPTPEGHDACLGELPGVSSACCGHGATPAILRLSWREWLMKNHIMSIQPIKHDMSWERGQR